MMTEKQFDFRERWPHYKRLMRLDRPIGLMLLGWPALWGLWMAAEGVPPAHLILIFGAGVILMRSAGCVINDYADQNIDGHVERTRERPLITGDVSPKEALAVAGVLVLLAFFLVLMLNALVFWLAIPALLLAATYPFAKRFLSIPQAYLGISFGFAIPMAFAAVQGTVPGVAWLMLLANVFWAMAYDTEYAMVDRPDDLKIGVKSMAITFGEHEVKAVMACYALTLLTLALVGLAAGMGPIFYLLSLVGAGKIAYDHYKLIRTRERDSCFKAFLHNNWFGAVIFVGIVLDFLFW